MSNKWMRKLGMGMSVIVTVSQLSGMVSFAASGDEDFDDLLEDKFQEEDCGYEEEASPDKEDDINTEFEENYDEDEYIKVDLSDAVVQAGGYRAPEKRRTASAGLYNSSSDSYVAAKKLLHTALLKREESIDISAYNITEDEIDMLYTSVLNTDPELFYVDSSFEISFTSQEDVCEVFPIYDSDQYSEADSIAFRSKGQEIVAMIDEDWTDLEKVLFLHDYIVQHVEYEKTEPYSKYNAYDALIGKEAVCNGYALAYTYLLSLAGIDSEVVISDTMCHAWNIVRLDGQYYYVDTTWDDHDEGYTRFWANVESALSLDGTKTAYCKSGKVHIYDFATMQETASYNYQQAEWPILDQEDYTWDAEFPCFTILDGIGYYLVPDGIYSMTSDGVTNRVYTITDEEKAAGRMYGLMKENGELLYEIAETPDTDTVMEGYYSGIVSGKVVSVSLDKESAELEIGENITLKQTISPADAVNKNVSWSSSNEAVATVDTNGTVSAVAAGTATITVTTEDGSKTASCEVTVVEAPPVTVDVESVSLNNAALELIEGENETLTATVSPTDATNKNVSWSSDNESVATVDANGKITAVAAGAATITVTTEDGSKTASCEVTVVEAPPVTVDVESVSLNNVALELTAGESETLAATVNPADATNKNISWSSNKEAVATVDANGKVTAVAAGTATITVTAANGTSETEDDKTATCTVTVTAKKTSPEIPEEGPAFVKDIFGKKIYYKDGEAQKDFSGLVNVEDTWYYVNKGVLAENKRGYVDFDGSKFLVVDGKLEKTANGLVQDPEHSEDWYFLSGGQAQTQYTGLVQYDGEWFYVNKGGLDTNLASYVEYDGGLFFVAAGRILTEVNGLAQDPNGSDWYYLANGQVQTQYTGLAQYDGEWFYVQKGRLAAEYITLVDYDGSMFCSVNGMIKEFDSLNETDAVIALCNNERRTRDLPLMEKGEELTSAAQARSEELTVSFTHQRPSGESCFTMLDVYGVKRNWCGENIAYGQKTAQNVVDAWMNSDGHRANILNERGRHIGVGRVQAENGRIYWTQMFTD